MRRFPFPLIPMADIQRDLELFHWNPPRMFPHVSHQRPKIESMLAQLAAVDLDRYEERLEKYNMLCDKYEVPRFPRVTVVKEEIPAKPMKVEKEKPVEVKVEEAANELEAVEEVKVEEKKPSRRKSSKVS